jgi:hypothetical protein
MEGFERTEREFISSPTARPSAETSAARFIALMPIAQALLVAVHVVSLSGSTTWAFLLFVVATGSVLSFVLASSDRNQLRARGFEVLPSPLWTLALPLAYLLRRARVMREIDWTSYNNFWQYIGLSLLMGAAGYALAFCALVISQLPSL